MSILNSNPFKEGTKAWIFCESADIDYKTGYSKIVDIEHLTALGLKTDNGGSWCRSDGPLGSFFNVHRTKRRGKIYSVQLVGYKQNDFTNHIDGEIIKAYKDEKCRVLFVGGKNIEIDHKDGRKKDFKLHDNQTIVDFQPLHKSVNIAKRDHCSTCVKTGLRFDARSLGYDIPQFIGPLKYTGSCIGCYWHDPKQFNAVVTANFEKDR